MQKATFAITGPHFFLPISAYISEANHESSIQSITSRFNVHGTLQIKQSNFLIFNPIFMRVSRNHIVHACR